MSWVESKIFVSDNAEAELLAIDKSLPGAEVLCDFHSTIRGMC